MLWIAETAHQIGLVPAVVAIVLTLRKRWLPEWAVWIAIGLGISWVADSVQFRAGGDIRGQYYWVPLQLWCALMGLKARWGAITTSLGIGAVWVAAAALFYPAPDYVMTGLGSAAILYAAHTNDDHPDLLFPVMVYFGFGTLAYFLMIDGFTQPPPQVGHAWMTYQLCRLIGIVGIAGAMVRLSR